ncbi:3899_t:CDS:1, partial [Gigaspora margarita]
YTIPENNSKTPISDETHKTATKCSSAIIPTNNESVTTQLQSPMYTILEIGSKIPT